MAPFDETAGRLAASGRPGAAEQTIARLARPTFGVVTRRQPAPAAEVTAQPRCAVRAWSPATCVSSTPATSPCGTRSRVTVARALVEVSGRLGGPDLALAADATLAGLRAFLERSP